MAKTRTRQKRKKHTIIMAKTRTRQKRKKHTIIMAKTRTRHNTCNTQIKAKTKKEAYNNHG